MVKLVVLMMAAFDLSPFGRRRLFWRPEEKPDVEQDSIDFEAFDFFDH